MDGPISGIAAAAAIGATGPTRNEPKKSTLVTRPINSPGTLEGLARSLEAC